MFYGECDKAVCCISKGYEHCGLCPDMPCKKLLDLFNVHELPMNWTSWFRLFQGMKNREQGRFLMSLEDIDLQWFAAEDEGRTEEPSELRLKKAREEGRIAKSQDLTSSLVFLTSLLVLLISAKSILVGCSEVCTFFFNRINYSITTPAFAYIFFRSLLRFVVPITAMGLVVGVISNIVQNKGFLFTTKAIVPKFSKIIPNFGEYFKKSLFSLKGLFNIVKSLGKVAIIIAICFFLLRKNIPDILFTIQNGIIIDSVLIIASVASKMLVIIAVLFVIISIPDYLVNKREFMESMKMTKQEVKQEYKEMEGDPEVKSRLKQAQRQLLQQNMPKAVKESDVVITNPTHFAVSVKYDTSVADSPMITAKGADEIAFQMRRIATENNIPIVENRPLARGLYTDTEVGDIIPDSYLTILATIYSEVLKYNEKSKK